MIDVRHDVDDLGPLSDVTPRLMRVDIVLRLNGEPGQGAGDGGRFRSSRRGSTIETLSDPLLAPERIYVKANDGEPDGMRGARAGS